MSSADITVATTMNDQWGIAWLRMPQITRPVTTVTIQMSPPLFSREISQPSVTPRAKGHRVDSQPEKLNGISSDWCAARARKAKAAMAT